LRKDYFEKGSPFVKNVIGREKNTAIWLCNKKLKIINKDLFNISFLKYMERMSKIVKILRACTYGFYFR
jgi:hypothetical protein